MVCGGDTVAGAGLVRGAQHPVCAIHRAVCLSWSSGRADSWPCQSACHVRRGLTLGAMVNKSRTIPAVLASVALTAFSAGCFHRTADSQQGTGNPAAAEFASALHDKVTTDAMMAHLSKLQDIANANNGTRAVGTPGYQASVDYVVNTLRNSGFDVQTPEFSARVSHTETPAVTVGGKTVEARALDFSIGTPPDGVSGPLVPSGDS